MGNYVLDWVPEDGSYRLWKQIGFGANVDPVTGDLKGSGTWSSIRTGHVLIPISGIAVLDWVPEDGSYRLWSFDPSSADPLPDLIASGTWSTIRTGHTMTWIRHRLY